MSDLYHGDFPVDMTPAEANRAIAQAVDKAIHEGVVVGLSAVAASLRSEELRIEAAARTLKGPLSPDDVREIRRLVRTPCETCGCVVKGADLARRYKVSPATIVYVVSGALHGKVKP